jgi:hypothetical protein
VIRALDSPFAQTRLTAEQRDTMRDAADTLVLANACDDDACAALLDARTVLLSILGPGCDPWTERLADDVEDAGPTSCQALAAYQRVARPASRQLRI